MKRKRLSNGLERGWAGKEKKQEEKRVNENAADWGWAGKKWSVRKPFLERDHVHNRPAWGCMDQGKDETEIE